MVKGVGPDWNSAQGSSDRGIVDEKLVSHHVELFITSHSENKKIEKLTQNQKKLYRRTVEMYLR